MVIPKMKKFYSCASIVVVGLLAFGLPINEAFSSLSTTTTTTATAAFTTTYKNENNYKRCRLGGSSSSRAWMTSVRQNEGRLTLEDEQVLFGDGQKPNQLLPLNPLQLQQQQQEQQQQVPHSRHRKKDRYGNIWPDTNVPLNPLDHSTTNPLINKLRTMRETVTNCPQLWTELAQDCPNLKAVYDAHLCDDETIDLTFSEMNVMVRKSAAVFTELGVTKGVHVAVLGENSAKWLMIDHGIQMAGGASAVRGADAPLDELRYIYEHSDSASIVVLQGPRLLQKLYKDALNTNTLKQQQQESQSQQQQQHPLGFYNDSHGPVRTIILIHREKKTVEDIAKLQEQIGGNVQIHFFSDLLNQAKPLLVNDDDLPNVGLDDLATIVYTSGTTGHPKGVMLSHGNLLHQTGHRLAPTQPYDETEPLPGEKMVSILPVWHITERAFELWQLSRGCQVVYSSIRTFKNDLAKHQPQWLVLVPRILEKIATGVQDKFAESSVIVQALVRFFTAVGIARATHVKIANGLCVGEEAPSALDKFVSKSIVAALNPLHAVGIKIVWSKVQQGFGGKCRVIISGGSALAGSLEQFYEAVGITICVGYGLTECSPIISYRRSDGNLVSAGCAGKAALDTEVIIVDHDSMLLNGSQQQQQQRRVLPHGQAGVVMARGPQVMKGYYKNTQATAKAIDSDGWFDTGDLGRINPATGDLILTGRAKDTIVLSNGENVEPQPIEDAILSELPNLVEQVMLTGQDGRRLIAIAVLKPSELVNLGYLDKALGDTLQAANEKVNDPKCSEEDRATSSETLNRASITLRQNQGLQQLLVESLKRGTANFRSWEQVSDVYITLEPFAMVNGQLTQSYKVKRDAVLKRYAESLPK